MSAISTLKSSPSGEKVTTKRKTRRLFTALALLSATALGTFVGMGLWPVPRDNHGDESTAGISNRASGLRQSFPLMIAPADNLPTGEKNNKRVALGRLLFFDPILSGDNDISCATCHHPDLGLSDGRAISMGKGGHGMGLQRSGGAILRRTSPSLWNTGYYHRQFWDGRAKDLEEQASSPIINEQEMGEDPERLLSEIKRIPEYVEEFDRAFDEASGSGLNMQNLAKALAAFERTLTANNSPFDRFVRGDRSALTDSQRRGFTVFRSGQTRCIECHGLPTFADRDFKAIGSLNSDTQPDLGHYEVTQQQSDKFAFKVPTLRNVVLTAPYMHNGSLKNLDEVIDLYSSGGRPDFGVPVDDKLLAFALTPEQRKDLIAFLFSLTDESNLPTIPERVPSGLPVVPRLDNPARKLVASYNTGSKNEKRASQGPQLMRVEPGQSIQQAIDKANPGDTIEVMPGVYSEQLVVDVDDLTLRGVAAADSNGKDDLSAVPADGSKRPLLDGKVDLSDGIIISGSNFRFEGFDIANYIGNAAFVQYASNVTLTDLRLEKTGPYGIHVISSSGVMVEKVTAHKEAEAGLYINSSSNTAIRRCEAYGNVLGIHIENCFRTSIESSFMHDNTCGLLISALPKNISTVAKECRVTGNQILNNNARNIGELGTLIGDLPRGIGILILAADSTEVTANEFRGNASYAAGIFGLSSITDSRINLGITSVPENNFIHDNTYSDNGRNPDGPILKAGLKGGDLVWDLSGWSNRWQESEASRSTPVLNASWPSFARRARWRLLNLLK